MKTEMGFEIQYFKDDYDKKCSIQESSAYEPHIWLGVHNPETLIMYKDAVSLGLNLKKKYPETNECGWCDYPIPDDVLISSRMHLNQEQAKELADKLLYFYETGRLQERNE